MPSKRSELYRELIDEDRTRGLLCLNLRNALVQAVRYTEVVSSYSGAMTAEQVEQKVKENRQSLAEVSIGANSCNTLARFNLRSARKLIEQFDIIFPPGREEGV